MCPKVKLRSHYSFWQWLRNKSVWMFSYQTAGHVSGGHVPEVSFRPLLSFGVFLFIPLVLLLCSSSRWSPEAVHRCEILFAWLLVSFPAQLSRLESLSVSLCLFFISFQPVCLSSVVLLVFLLHLVPFSGCFCSSLLFLCCSDKWTQCLFHNKYFQVRNASKIIHKSHFCAPVLSFYQPAVAMRNFFMFSWQLSPVIICRRNLCGWTSGSICSIKAFICWSFLSSCVKLSPLRKLFFSTGCGDESRLETLQHSWRCDQELLQQWICVKRLEALRELRPAPRHRRFCTWSSFTSSHSN